LDHGRQLKILQWMVSILGSELILTSNAAGGGLRSFALGYD
jgi:hypothetical protein